MLGSQKSLQSLLGAGLDPSCSYRRAHVSLSPMCRGTCIWVPDTDKCRNRYRQLWSMSVDIALWSGVVWIFGETYSVVEFVVLSAGSSASFLQRPPIPPFITASITSMKMTIICWSWSRLFWRRSKNTLRFDLHFIQRCFSSVLPQEQVIKRRQAGSCSWSQEKHLHLLGSENREGYQNVSQASRWLYNFKCHVVKCREIEPTLISSGEFTVTQALSTPRDILLRQSLTKGSEKAQEKGINIKGLF